jgi:Flp pilus assembly protein TadG
MIRQCRLFLILRGESGATLPEFALTFSALMGFLIGITQVCVGYYTWEWMSECAREGTRYAIVRGSTCETSAGSSCVATASTVNSYVTSISFPNIGGGTMSANTTYPDYAEAPGERVKVTVTYTLPWKIPFVSSTAVWMTTSSEMYIIQ